MDSVTPTACLRTGIWHPILDTALDTPVEHVVVLVTLMHENTTEELAQI